MLRPVQILGTARHSSMDGESPGSTARATDEHKLRGLDATNGNSEGIGSDTMGAQSRPWQELTGEEAENIDKKTTPSASNSISGGDNGVVGSDSAATVKRGTADEIPIEMDSVTAHATSSEPASHAPSGSALGIAATGSDSAAAEAAAGVEYKVYKRRWFGLMQLTLLNIIISWDVSCLSVLLPPWSLPLKSGALDLV